MSRMSDLYLRWCEQNPIRSENEYPDAEEQRDLMQKALEEQEMWEQLERDNESSAAGK